MAPATLPPRPPAHVATDLATCCAREVVRALVDGYRATAKE